MWRAGKRVVGKDLQTVDSPFGRSSSATRNASIASIAGFVQLGCHRKHFKRADNIQHFCIIKYEIAIFRIWRVILSPQRLDTDPTTALSN